MRRRLSRSENMSRIRGRDTRPEMVLRKALWRAGCRYRLRSDLPGHPDLVFAGAQLALFVDGCFWHGCPIHYSSPSSRCEFWAGKLRRNVEHDLEVDDSLLDIGWQPFHVWQHELREVEDIVTRIGSVLRPSRTWDSNPALVRVDSVAESPIPYDAPTPSPWYRCPCGSKDVRVLAVAGPGSLRPRAKRKPELVKLVCVRCRSVFDRTPDLVRA